MAFSVFSPSDRTVTVNSNESEDKLRSSLKRPNNHQQPSPQIPRRRVRFGNDQVKLITPLFSHDLWTHPESNAERSRKDKNSIYANRSAGQYVKAHWVAYHQFTACRFDNIKPSVSNDIKKRLVFGVKLGHRSLERHSTHFLHERQKQATVPAMCAPSCLPTAARANGMITSAGIPNAARKRRATGLCFWPAKLMLLPRGKNLLPPSNQLSAAATS